MVVVLRSRTGSSRLQKRLDAIRAAGQPTNARELEQWIGTVPPDENGAPALLAAADSRTLDEAALDRVHAALQYPHFRNPIVPTNGLAALRLSHLVLLKNAAKALTTEANSAAQKRNGDLACLRLHDAISIGATLDEEPVFISYLVRIACYAISATGTESVLTQSALIESQLTILQTRFQQAEGTNVLIRALIGERALASDEFSKNQPGIGLLILPGQLGVGATVRLGQLADSFYVASGMMKADLNHYLEGMEHLLSVAGTLDSTSKAVRDSLDADLNSRSGAWAHPLSGMVLSGLSRVVGKELRHVATMRCAQTACAVERYRRSHAEQLPETLDALVPTYLSKVPEDPMDGHPLRFRKLPLGYVVYSIGEDGTDDGGVAPANRPKNGKGGWDYAFTVGR